MYFTEDDVRPGYIAWALLGWIQKETFALGRYLSVGMPRDEQRQTKKEYLDGTSRGARLCRALDDYNRGEHADNDLMRGIQLIRTCRVGMGPKRQGSS